MDVWYASTIDQNRCPVCMKASRVPTGLVVDRQKNYEACHQTKQEFNLPAATGRHQQEGKTQLAALHLSDRHSQMDTSGLKLSMIIRNLAPRISRSLNPRTLS